MAKTTEATPKREQVLLQRIEELQSELAHTTNTSEQVSAENKDMLETIQELREHCEDLQDDLANQRARAKVKDTQLTNYLKQAEREFIIKEQIHAILDLQDVPHFKQANQDGDMYELTILQRITLLTAK